MGPPTPQPQSNTFMPAGQKQQNATSDYMLGALSASVLHAPCQLTLQTVLWASGAHTVQCSVLLLDPIMRQFLHNVFSMHAQVCAQPQHTHLA